MKTYLEISPNCNLKKFYQVTFLNKDSNEITIYTGVLLSKKENDAENNFLGLQYKNNNAINIKTEDKTVEFCNDKKGWQSVWGNEESRQINIPEFENIFKKINENAPIPNIDNKEIIYIENSEGKDTFRSLSVFEHDLIQPNNNKEQIHEVEIKIPSQLSKNLDCIAWFLTTISIKENDISWDQYSLEIKKTDTWHCNDFKFYFILPEFYELKRDSTEFETVNRENQNPSFDFNAFSEMRSDSSKYFNDWINHENINNRKVYKISKLRSTEENKSKHKITFYYDSTKINKLSVLVFSIISSVLFAFGLDYTRMTSLKSHFLFQLPTLEYTLLVILLVMIFVSMNFDSFKPVSKKRKKKRKYYRAFSLGLFFVWFLLVFTPIKDCFVLFEGIIFEIISLSVSKKNITKFLEFTLILTYSIKLIKIYIKEKRLRSVIKKIFNKLFEGDFSF